jgi:predicted esterase
MAEERCRFEVALECEYLLDPPDEGVSDPWIIVALHGYGQNPRDMLRLTREAVGSECWIASVRAPHSFSLKPFTAGSDVGYHWGVPGPDWPAVIRLHHLMVRSVLGQLESSISRRPERTVLLGFSQPVGLNYRFVGTYPGLIRGVIGICGGVPKEWEKLSLHRIAASLLHISRSEDEFYPIENVKQFPRRLQLFADDVEFHLLPGRHRFPSDAARIVRPWLKRFS